ncbi:MAG: hypothetical protein J0I33_07755 [Microbacterium ginsengisoli]|jgi:hypothetical protein|uniref:hypothetical protein n=1 Tax=Microbacterium TaxID=33882 RepID=UPI0006F7AD96|nr:MULTISPECIES: hypothetical protein [unclassified Microbacterium]KQR97692.1 hypothetical protein ASF93_13265 [Microbacterium sp. Leaf347]KQS01716.1 hypothetical protein ASG00_09780 [Microbacterium sp. Leaf351]MBN9198518.1 hypothetical protein [Microbacterium ginsengisoli]OJU78097.1 MAG: hypothetical protein BGO15_02535 [Microbacterium sp. 71-23]
MSDELADFYVHTVTVQTSIRTSGYGVDVFNDPVMLTPTGGTGCFVERKRRLVRNNAGAEVVSETTLYTYPAAADLFTVDSLVSTGGVDSRVITVAQSDSGDLDLPDHIAVYLT